MKSRLLLATLLLPCFGVFGQTRPLDAEGACPTKNPTGVLRRISQGPHAGKPLALKQAAPVFAATHAQATSGDYPWLKDLQGQAGANRLFIQKGRQVVVLTLCDPAACRDLRAYVAFEPATGAWGANVFEGGHVRPVVPGAQGSSLVAHPELLSQALICAANTDMEHER